MKPVLLEKTSRGYVVRINLKKITHEEHGKVWECDEVISPTTRYDDVVAAIIRSHYTLEAEIAMLNNYINEPEERQAEWDEYQAVRADAKAYAGDTLGLE